MPLIINLSLLSLSLRINATSLSLPSLFLYVNHWRLFSLLSEQLPTTGNHHELFSLSDLNSLGRLRLLVLFVLGG
ncbi:hypothetical protein RchiOBHm_Chr7g0202281 [Rosa chinensis]|uniref:Secreted protein n=1 Tax=Rosa chinensis TaxID=74649 RepID=A0A2P6P860_ROSCH|nr:hypothetical protein RchiOBHm_Chr7g0202281 [Rosa chinensis]